MADKQTSTSTLERPSPAQGITYEEIEARAYAIFLARGRRHGDDQSDWFRAEAELRRERGLEKRDPSRND
jgi:DNA relaxase NicK